VAKLSERLGQKEPNEPSIAPPRQAKGTSWVGSASQKEYLMTVGERAADTRPDSQLPPETPIERPGERTSNRRTHRRSQEAKHKEEALRATWSQIGRS